MSRTWLLRGAAVAVFGVLVGAWTGGLVGTGETAPPASKPNNVVSSEAPAADDEDPVVFEQARLRRARDRGASRSALTEPSPSATATPTDRASDPTTSGPTSDAPTPDEPSPSDEPSDKPSDKPTDPATPSEPGPSSPPTQPSEECTELVEVLDCVLDPITGGP